MIMTKRRAEDRSDVAEGRYISLSRSLARFSARGWFDEDFGMGEDGI